jgi:predicted GNAT superfamily acetyltransferase
MTSGDPWALAGEAADRAGVELRPLVSLDDADALLRVMIATWGEYQLIPREMIRALVESGNIPYGAFDADQIVGFVLGWAGVDQEGLHVHSHALAAMPDRRHGGVGYALKLAQRAQALDQGIKVVRWTFDPLIARNAYFNLHKLGAVADRFHRNYYGEMLDEVNRGERTDRLLVRWDLGREPGPRSIHGEVEIEVPANHESLRETKPDAARRSRDEVAAQLEELFAAGMWAVGFDRSTSAYQFATSGSVTGDP